MSLFTLQTRDQTQYGPVELETLRAWAREGRVLAEDRIYDHAEMKWITAAEFVQISDLLPPAVPSAAAAPEATPDAGSKDPLAKTHYEDALTRMERKVAAEIQSSRQPAERPAATKPSDSKLRLTRDLVRTDGPAAGAGPNKPPTVLERITRILISPFARRRDGGGRKESQRVK